MSKTILLIHGAWLTPASWDLFKGEFESNGYTCVAPAWPTLDRPIADLRSAPAPEFAKLGIVDLVDHYAAIVPTLAEPPIIIGHSFGGLITQMLLDRRFGVAGVALDPAPPAGIIPGVNSFRSSKSVIFKWNGWKQVHTMSEEAFAWGFGNELPADQQRSAYEQYIVPAPGRIFFQAALGRANKVRWDNPARPPLLFTAGEKDRTVEPGMVRANYKKASKAPSTTTLIELPGRCHFLGIQPGWQEITAKILDWVKTTGV